MIGISALISSYVTILVSIPVTMFGTTPLTKYITKILYRNIVINLIDNTPGATKVSDLAIELPMGLHGLPALTVGKLELVNQVRIMGWNNAKQKTIAGVFGLFHGAKNLLLLGGRGILGRLGGFARFADNRFVMPPEFLED
jgi:hypothetical protein